MDLLSTQVLAEWTFLGGPLEGARHRILDVCQVLCTNGGIHHHVGTIAFWTKAPNLALSHLGNRKGEILLSSGLSYFGANTQPRILPVKTDMSVPQYANFHKFSKQSNMD